MWQAFKIFIIFVIGDTFKYSQIKTMWREGSTEILLLPLSLSFPFCQFIPSGHHSPQFLCSPTVCLYINSHFSFILDMFFDW